MAAAHKIREIFFRQLLPGRDVCLKVTSPSHNQIFPAARQMANYMYLIGDKAFGKCVIVDACWDFHGIVEVAKQAELKLTSTILTHYHFDHMGGVVNGVRVEGLYDMVKTQKVPAYVNEKEADMVRETNALQAADIHVTKHNTLLTIDKDGERVEHNSGSAPLVELAKIDHEMWNAGKGLRLRFLATPGHSPGGQCVLVNGSDLIAGDTLFPGSCGRLDLQDSDKRKMWDSLRMLSSLPDNINVWPGHAYGGPKTTIGQERKNGFLQAIPLDHWMKMMG